MGDSRVREAFMLNTVKVLGRLRRFGGPKMWTLAQISRDL